MVNINKVKNLAQFRGIKFGFLCQQVGEDPTYLDKVKFGRRKMERDRIELFAKILGTTYEYLTDQTDDPAIPHSSGGKIKVWGDVAAGIPIEQIDNFDPDDSASWEEIDTRTARNGEYFALRIKGDSMSPVIMDGDIAIVRHQSDCENGDIAIVAVNGDTATCKRVRFTDAGIMLIPLNTAYEPIFFSNDQVRDLPVTILGKVVEIRRSV